MTYEPEKTLRQSLDCATYSPSLDLGKRLPDETSTQYPLERELGLPHSPLIIQTVADKAIRLTKFNQKEESL